MSCKTLNLTVRPLKLSDIDGFHFHPAHEHGLENVKRLFQDGMIPHQALFLRDDKPILMAGLVEVWDRVWSTWTIFGEDFRALDYRGLIVYFNNYLNLMDFDRMYHTVDVSKPWTKHMAEALGFEYEGVMKKYMYGKDYMMYARVK